MTALLTKFIRDIESKLQRVNDSPISIGGEIGHIGGKNSTPEEFEAFMQGYIPLIKKNNLTGISKVSVQTGTSHGGTILPDGSIQQVDLDFSVLKSISEVARNKYHIGGSVQHGASTLPNELFNHFPLSNTLEIHLATGFQNIVYDTIPHELKEEMFEWVRENCQDERKDTWNNEQFIYKCRKKALGPFKKQLWHLSESDKKPILDNLNRQLQFLFEKLNIYNTRSVVEKYLI
jgi:fructose/tagatose bisphosphate aldolase